LALYMFRDSLSCDSWIILNFSLPEEGLILDKSYPVVFAVEPQVIRIHDNINAPGSLGRIFLWDQSSLALSELHRS
jgi:hypothetical protein